MATQFDKKHIHAITKERIRDIYSDEINAFFQRKINLLNMGGAESAQEKNLNLRGLLKNAVSIEIEKIKQEEAKRTAPENVEVLRGNIFKYLMTGEEDTIIFDTVNTFVKRHQWFEFLSNNRILKKTLIIINVVDHIRAPKNLNLDSKEFYKEYGFIQDIKNRVENGIVRLIENPRIVEYKNSSSGQPMVSYFFKFDIAA